MVCTVAVVGVAVVAYHGGDGCCRLPFVFIASDRCRYGTVTAVRVAAAVAVVAVGVKRGAD